MRRVFHSVFQKINKRTIVRITGLTLSVSLAQRQYLLSCEEELKPDLIESRKEIQSINSKKDEDVQIISKYSSVADLIMHHRTESECIVILPTCSDSTKQLILSSLQRKRDQKSIKIFIFDPPQQQTHLSAKDEKRESEKQKDVIPLLENAEFFGINSFGDLKFFSLQTTKNTETISNFRQQIQRALNFFYPPSIIRERDYTSLVDQIQNMSDESRLVICYIPEEKVYDANLPRISSFDSFRQGRIKNIPSLEKRFLDISYNYIEKNTKFILVRSSEIATALSIGSDDAGELYEIKKSTKMSNKESNFMFAGREYLYNKMEWDPNVDTNQFLTDKQIEMKIYEKSTNYVQQFDVDTELRAFLVSQKEFGTTKFLVYYSAEVLEKEYEDKVIKKLISVKKNINDSKFCVIFTKNPVLLKNFFGIIPEQSSDTVRLFDFSRQSEEQQSYYSNWEINQIENEGDQKKSNVLMDDSSEYERTARAAKRFKYEGKITRNKLTFFVKQSLNNNKEEPTYAESDGRILNGPSKTIYLNSVNFEKEILSIKQANNQVISDEISLVYFYKPGCPNCTAMGQALEKFASDLTSVQADLGEYEKEKRKVEKFDETLLNLYNLQNYSRFKALKVYRYNIYNESKAFPSPSAAPLVYIFTQNNILKPIQADLLKDRVNINDAEKVSRYLFKKVDLLNL